MSGCAREERERERVLFSVPLGAQGARGAGHIERDGGHPHDVRAPHPPSSTPVRVGGRAQRRARSGRARGKALALPPGKRKACASLFFCRPQKPAPPPAPNTATTHRAGRFRVDEDEIDLGGVGRVHCGWMGWGWVGRGRKKGESESGERAVGRTGLHTQLAKIRLTPTTHDEAFLRPVPGLGGRRRRPGPRHGAQW